MSYWSLSVCADQQKKITERALVQVILSEGVFVPSDFIVEIVVSIDNYQRLGLN